jgi:hypothetical protein
MAALRRASPKTSQRLLALAAALIGARGGAEIAGAEEWLRFVSDFARTDRVCV